MANLPAYFLLLCLLASTMPACGTDCSKTLSSSPDSASTTPAPIQDNSFLIEEAYNQENGVVQHISYMQRSLTTGDWIYTQTDEWPLRTIKHQLSLTLAGAHSGAGSGWGWGDTAVNYRYQLVGNGEAKVAIAPRLSLLIPSGSFRSGRGTGGLGLQTNLPVSIQHNRWLVTHWNLGTTWIPRARNTLDQQAPSLNFNLGQSFVWLASSRFNALLETLWTSTADVSGRNIIVRRESVFVSPGMRWAHTFASGLQIVPGFGVPLGVGPSSGQRGLIVYLSFEHPWGIARSR
ncbi:MAG TPA: hypothetical protein VMT53_23615 [Terriglobales bacterium]|nr:hypothetical protein [Terriglobales bacterium]